MEQITESIKHAKWEIIESEEYRNLCECSNCKDWIVLYRKDYFPNFCPNCGAKMDMETEYEID